MGKRRISLVAALAAVALVATSMTAYAFWNSGYNGASNTANAAVVIGEGGVVDTTLSLSDALVSGTNLIPVGITAADDEVNSVTFTVKVRWASGDGNELAGVTAPLAVDVSDIKSGNTSLSSDAQALFTISNNAPTQIAGEAAAVTVTFTITMAEPANKTFYDEVAGKNLSFAFSFSVAANTGE